MRTKKNLSGVVACGLAIFIFASPLAGEDAAQAIKKVTGSDERLSLELKGTDILDVFRLLSVKSELNIVAGANVRGRVTMFLKDVNPWDAFLIILETNNLAFEIKGGIIKVMTDRDYEVLYGDKFQIKTSVRVVSLKHAVADDVATSLSQLKSKVGKVITDSRSNSIILMDTASHIQEMETLAQHMDVSTETRVYKLYYGKVEDVIGQIEKALTEGVGKIKSDVRTNKVAVTDLPTRFNEISHLIEEFDEKTPQVLIVTKIVEISLSDDFGFGVDWSLFSRLVHQKLNEGEKLFSANLDVNSIASATTGVSTFTLRQAGDLTAVVQALKTFGQTNTLSSPRILVANNEEAKILIGTDEAFVTQQTVVSSGGSNTSDEVQFVEVGTKLGVTPTVNRDGFVTLNLRPEVSSVTRTLVVGASNVSNDTAAAQTARTTVPIVSTSEVETTVLIKSGHTVVIGGLIKDVENIDTQEIPILGSLPLIGGFFRSEDREIDKTELVVFVTPHIVTGEQNDWDMVLDGMSEDVKEMSFNYAGSGPEAPAHGKVPLIPPTITPGPSSWAPIEPLQTGISVVPTLTIPLAYQSILRDRILDSLSELEPDVNRGGEVRVSFVLSPEGALLGVPTIVGRQNELLDRLVMQSVYNSSPFPDFPSNFSEEEETFNLVIAFE
jgi:type II secretory pathway component GspD/PulD (secretin)